MRATIAKGTISKERLYAIADLELDDLKEFISETDFDIDSHEVSRKDNLLLVNVRNENYDICSYLLNSGADPDWCNKMNRTALHIATENSNHQIINLLLDNKANPNIKDDQGNTPMHLAAYKGDCKIIRLLQHYRADNTITNHQGMLPIDCAKDNGQMKCVNVLLDLDSNTNRRLNSQFNTAPKLRSTRSCFSFLMKKQLESKEDDESTKSPSKVGSKEINLKRMDSNSKRNINVDFEDNNIAESMIDHSDDNMIFPWFGTEKGIGITIEDGKQIGLISPYNIIDIEQFNSFGNPNGQCDDILEEKDSFTDGVVYMKIKSRRNNIKDYEFARKSMGNSLKNTNNLKFSMTRESHRIASCEEIDFSISIISSGEVQGGRDEGRQKDKRDEEEDEEFCNSEEDDDSIIDNANDGEDEEDRYEDNIGKDGLFSKRQFSDDINATSLTLESNYKSAKTTITKELTIENVLKSIGMERYTQLLLKEGFDDIPLLLTQMKKGYGLTDAQLKQAGITLPGDRARILIRLQEESKAFEIVFQGNSVYHHNSSKFEEGRHDSHVKMIDNWLKMIKLENYLRNFYEGSYHSLELLFIQMASHNPINEDILRDELKIDKLGYRARILNQLKEDSSDYIEKLKMRNVEYTKQHTAQVDSCQCLIF